MDMLAPNGYTGCMSVTQWLVDGAAQVPFVSASDRAHVLGSVVGRVAVALFRAGLIALLLDSSFRVRAQDITSAVQ